MYVVTINMPNLDKGEVVEIDGLGLFENGYEYQVGADEADQYRTKHAKQSVSHSDDGVMTVDTTDGETLLQAFKKFKGVDVRKMNADELKDFAQAEKDDEPAVDDSPVDDPEAEKGSGQ